MMKKIICLLFVLTVALPLFAQDVITTKEGEEIQSKVLKISDSEVEYKKWTNQDGPTFVMKVEKIFMIKFQNGEKKVFDGKQDVAEQKSPEVVEQKSPEVVEQKLPEEEALVLDSIVERPISFNINFGTAPQSLKTSSSGLDSWTGKSFFTGGFIVGVSWEANLYKGLGLEFGYIGLSILNERFSLTISSKSSSASIRKFEAIDICLTPVLLQYRYKFNWKHSIYVATGPALDLALSHKYYYNIKDVDGNLISDNIKYRCGEGELKHPLYVYWDVKLGYRFLFFKFMLGTSIGLNNIAWETSEKVTVWRPLYLMVSINL